MIKIFIDALCDMPQTKKEALELECFPYIFDIEGREYFTGELKESEIEDYLKKEITPRIARPALSEWNTLIQKTFEEGNDIFYIASTSKMTGALNSIKISSKLFKSKFPNRKIEAVDTLLTANAQACLIEELLSYNLQDLDSLISKTKELASKTSYSGVLSSTKNFNSNNRLEEVSSKIPEIKMRDGIVIIEKEFEDKKEAIKNIIKELETKDLARVNITVAHDINEEEFKSYYIEETIKKLTSSYCIETLDSCQYACLGLGAISISWVEK